MEIALNNDGPVTERQIAFIDKNRDLHLRTVRQIGAPKYNKLCEYFSSLFLCLFLLFDSLFCFLGLNFLRFHVVFH